MDPTCPTRRSVLVQALACAGLATLAPRRAWTAGPATVGNVTGLYAVEVARIAAPTSADEVSALVRAWPGAVAVGGGRYSMGGQVAIQGGLHLDLRPMNRLVWLDVARRRARVQAGMRWRDLQDHLDPHGLAVHTMQSYANFTVGGSVSVNAHGRYVRHGPVGHSVRALQIVQADGRRVEAGPGRNEDLFRAAIGGYGAVGVITEVELDLAANVRIERRVQAVALDDYVAWFQAQVVADDRAVLHNADLLPPDFDAPVAVTWRRADDSVPLTEPARLVARGARYALEQSVIWATTELPGGTALRSRVIHPLLQASPAVTWLNHEASLDVAQLEPRSRRLSTYVLQEYFVPPSALGGFVRVLGEILRRHRVEALNVSIRHTPADTVSALPWAPQERFSLVLYFKQRISAAAQEAVGRWTRELIGAALAHGGRYYLPYQLHASRAQFDAAYPEAARFRALKRAHDPSGRFSNELWRRYL